MIHSILYNIWLSQHEIDLFIILLQWWRQSTTTLSRKLKKPRTTLYTHLDSLITKWLIQIEQNTRGRRFKALGFEELVISIEEKQKTIWETLNDLIKSRTEYEILESNNTFKPKVKIYDTKESRNIIYKKIQNFKEAYSIFNYDAAISFLKRNKKRRAQAWIIPPWSHIKEMLVDSKNARIYKKKREKINNWSHEIKLIDQKHLWSIQSDILLIDGIFYHTSLTENITMIEIHDPIFYNTQKSMFELLWNKY